MSRINDLSLLLLAAAAVAWPQAPQSPELKQLQWLVGAWSCETKDPAGKLFTTRDECAWEKGGGILTCREYDPAGAAPSLALLSFAYDPQAKVYRRMVLASNGFAAVFTGSVKDRNFDFTASGTWQGKPAKFEFKGDVTSHFVNRVSVDGGPWQVARQGKCTLVK